MKPNPLATRRALTLNQLETLGPRWQRMIRDGYGQWKGDPHLTIAFSHLTDEVEVWYRRPDDKDQRILHVPAEGFDIHRLLDQLRKADNVENPVHKKVEEADAINEAIVNEQDSQVEAQKEAFTEKMRWALKKVARS